MSEMTPEVKSVLAKVEKLLRLAASNPNEQEAASATAKAQELLAAYNLDMAAVEEQSGGTGKRAEENLLGGRFEWQRSLWEAIADLNFCMYFNQYVFVESELGTAKDYRKDMNGKWRWMKGMYQYRHRIIGRVVNIAATKAMAEYLEGVCDRLAKERCRATNERANGRWANSFRDGLTQRVCLKIYDRRAEVLSTEQAERAAVMKAAAESTMAGVSSSSALTLASFAKSEADANTDFAFGEGTSAQWAADRARRAAAAREADEEYTRWAAANPEKAAKEEAKQKAKDDRAAERRRGQYFKGKDSRGFMDGYKAGDSVSLDMQADHAKPKGYLK